MTECIAPLNLDFHPDLPIHVRFDAPEISSDGGALLLRQIDDRLGLSALIADRLPDERDPAKVQHSRLEQVRQRLYQIALGYEDCNDAQSLRRDPLLLTVCDRTPEDPQGLSSQPTLSRLENALTGADLRKLMQGFEQAWVDSLPDDTSIVILDIDTTDDPVHGHQQLSFFHGYYDQHMRHPLLLFDGVTGELIAARLRPGNAPASRGATLLLRSVIRALKKRFPSVQIVVRGDSGFCVPRVLEALEGLNAEYGDVDYVLGLAQNPVLLRLAEPAMTEAAHRYQATHQHVRLFTSFEYAAKSWSRPRRVIAKAEHDAKGANPRFVVTSLEEFPPGLIYEGYCERGQSENFIKDFKNAIQGDRLSCSRFTANFFRLLLHGAAYRLMHALRRAAGQVRAELGRVQLDTLRLRLLKVAAVVSQSVRRILVKLPRAFPLAQVFERLALRVAPS
jgi:hypothetical protein